MTEDDALKILAVALGGLFWAWYLVREWPKIKTKKRWFDEDL